MVIAELFSILGLQSDERSWQHGHELIDSLKHALEGLAAFEIGKSIAEHLGEMFTGAAEQVETADRLAQQLGMTANAVQELGYAAQMTHVPAEALQTSLQHLALGMADARKTGSGPLVDALGTLGVSFDQVRGKTPDDVLGILADHIAKLPDGFAKTGAAMQAFGRGGAELIPLLNKGAGGIAELRQEAVSTGNAIEGPGAEALRGYDDAMLSLHSSAKGLENQLAVALAPTVEDLAKRFEKWLDKHHDEIIDGITKAAHLLGKALEEIPVVIDWITDHAGTLKIALEGLLAIKVGQLAIGFVQAIDAVAALASKILTVLIPAEEAAAAASKGIGVGAGAAGAGAGTVGAGEGALAVGAGEGALASIAGAALPVAGVAAALYGGYRYAFGDQAASMRDTQDRQEAGDQYYQEHGTYDGMPQDQWAQAAAAGWQQSKGDASTVYTPSSGGGGSAPSINAPITVNVDAGNADANQVANIAGRVVRDHLNGVLRDAHAGTGGHDL